MIKEPVERGRKHKYGLVAITHSISRMNSTVVDLCNTKLIFGRTVSTGKTWFVNNIGKDRTKELAHHDPNKVPGSPFWGIWGLSL